MPSVTVIGILLHRLFCPFSLGSVVGKERLPDPHGFYFSFSCVIFPEQISEDATVSCPEYPGICWDMLKAGYLREGGAKRDWQDFHS